MRKIQKKLKNNKGETIGEVLVALLISALALMMLAGTIATSSGLITKSKDRQKAYYSANESLNMIPQNEYQKLTVSVSDDAVSNQISISAGNDIYYYENSVIEKTPVIAYEKKESGISESGS